MHPMLQMTVASGIIAFLAAVLMPIIPLKVRKVMVVLVVTGICYLTLFRVNDGGHRLMLEPFWSFRQWNTAGVRWQIYMNIFLFIPYGAILKALGVKHPIFVALLTSIFIELTQYVFALGLCETDDVINNTLGAAIGYGLFVKSDKAFKKVKSEVEKQMNENQRYICQIVGAALLGSELPSASASDWNAVYQECTDQAILAIPAPILQKLSMPKELCEQWKLEMITRSAQSIRLAANQNELIQLLKDNKIPYVILKGVAAAKYYPQPWLRTMGDVDLIVPPSWFEQTKQLLIRHEFKAKDEDHEGSRHVAFSHNGVHYELHRYFSTTDDETGKKLDELVYEGIENGVEAKVMDYSFSVLPEKINGIVLLSHIRQHLRSGLGLRQMIDWFMYVKNELHDEQWPDFNILTDQVGLTKLAKVATRIGQLYFGLDDSITWFNDVDKEVCEDLLDHIFRSGNFGHKDIGNSNAVFAMTRLRQHFFRTLQDNGERNWKLLKKHAWLKPFAWLYQLCRYIRLGLSNKQIRAKVGEDRERSKELAELMAKLEH